MIFVIPLILQIIIPLLEIYILCATEVNLQQK